MIFKKLLLILGGLLLMTTLTACSTSKRAEFEKRFAKVGEIYPTKNVSDLFEKFPDGFHIRHMRYEYVDNKTYYHNLNMVGDPETKQITGEYDKSYFDNNEDITVFDKSVQYTEDKGLQFSNGDKMDPFMTDFKFAFEWFELDREKLSSLEFRSVYENPVSGGYGLHYFIKDETIYNHFKIKNRNKLAFSIYNYRWGEEDKYSVELLVLDMSKENNVDYFLENIYEK